MKTLRLARSLAGGWTLAALTGLVACHPGVDPATPTSPAPEPGDSQQKCKTLEPPTLPVWTAAPAMTPQPSTLRVELELPMDLLLAEFERRVPRRLAEGEDHPIGAAGRVTYEVRRGKPRLESTANALIAHVPVQIEMSVCKPLGSLCLTYGRCSPRYDITATLRGPLTPSGELPPIVLSQRVKAGCRIGLDVTPTVTSVVEQQLALVQKRVQDTLPELKPWLEEQALALENPIELGPNYCLEGNAKKLSVPLPKVSEDRATLGASAVFTLKPSACDQTPSAPSPPRLESELKPRKTHLQVPELISTEALSAALRDKLAQADQANLEIELRQVIPGREGLLLELAVQGSHCGPLYLVAQPRASLQGLTLELKAFPSTSVEPDLLENLQASFAGPLALRLASAELVDSLPSLTAAALPLIEQNLSLALEVRLPEWVATQAQVVSSGVLVTQELKKGLKARVTGPLILSAPGEN